MTHYHGGTDWQEGGGEGPDPRIFSEIDEEMNRADAKFGPQYELPWGTGGVIFPSYRNTARKQCQDAAESGTCSWQLILQEEVYEAFAETEPELLRAELLQVAAVAVRWIDAIDALSGESLTTRDEGRNTG